jgi:hypothetical protein
MLICKLFVLDKIFGTLRGEGAACDVEYCCWPLQLACGLLSYVLAFDVDWAAFAAYSGNAVR